MMWNTFLTAAVGALAGSLVGLIFYLIAYRKIKQYDDRVVRLEDEVRVAQENRIVEIESNLEEAKKSRGRIHDAIDEIPKQFVSQAKCGKEHDKVHERFEKLGDMTLRLERVATQVEETVDKIESVQVQQREMTKTLAALDERMNDVRMRAG